MTTRRTTAAGVSTEIKFPDALRFTSAGAEAEIDIAHTRRFTSAGILVELLISPPGGALINTIN